MLFVAKLIWDDWNVLHIAEHDVVPDEVEQVCHRQPVVRQGKTGRLLVIGPTQTGKILVAVLAPEEGTYYVVTAKPANRSERQLCQNEKGGESA